MFYVPLAINTNYSRHSLHFYWAAQQAKSPEQVAAAKTRAKEQHEELERKKKEHDDNETAKRNAADKAEKERRSSAAAATGKRKMDAISPQEEIQAKLSAKRTKKDEAAAVQKPVLEAHFPERTATHYHDEDLLQSICLCAAVKSPPTMDEAVELLTMLGVDL
jgi:hypothetical protein